ncbi:uncharacterized protein LOC112567340 [Pomacea canaliculata]|uniref:uncharacterized protein LOC112567340 n=1 Tax=Pomacea canaliculata TaxID=400727 RepID=UPI000D73CBBC|nr:uncharacterized protein LOC112567340 [Pomacea canaliculata]
MDKFPGSPMGMESGGAAPFHDNFTDTSHGENLAKSFSELLDIEERPGKVDKDRKKRYKRIKAAHIGGSVLAFLCGMLQVAAGASVFRNRGTVLTLLGLGLLFSGAGRLLIAGASVAVWTVEMQRKGSLQTEWKAFFQRIVTAMLRQLPEKCPQIKGRLRQVVVDFNYQQKNSEICSLAGNLIAIIGGIIAAVAVGHVGGAALPAVAAAMIVSGAGAMLYAAASLARLQPKSSVANGIVEICNFTEMERLHILTKQPEDIGINVLRLHKNYKDAKRTKLAGSLCEIFGGLFIVASGGVGVWTGEAAIILFGAGLIVFGAAVALTAGASFAAGMFGRRMKSRLLTDWKEWKEWLHLIEMDNLRGLQEKSKKMADKIEEAANKIDSSKSTCRTIKAGGEGISVAAGFVAAVGAVGTVVTGGALPLAAAAVGAVTYGAGKIISSGASVAQNTVEQTFLECLQEEWDELSPLLSREIEVLRSKAKGSTAEFETNLTNFFQTLASTAFDINALALKSVISPVSQISIDFRRLVSTMAENSYEKKSEVSQMLRKLAGDLENNVAGMITACEELYSRSFRD